MLDTRSQNSRQQDGLQVSESLAGERANFLPWKAKVALHH